MSAASDAEGMADLADASLLVVRQNAAAAPALNNAVASLDGHKAVSYTHLDVYKRQALNSTLTRLKMNLRNETPPFQTIQSTAG